MDLEVKYLLEDFPFHYRPGTSDERVIEEVLNFKMYRRVRIGFDVSQGEHWLDLGANIGAFAAYCRLAGATCDCYEPEQGCFKLLRKNTPGMLCRQMAVTNLWEDTLTFWTSEKPHQYTRGTIYPNRTTKLKTEVDNLHGSYFTKKRYDGIKVDVEGAEAGLIDEWLFPQCDKLCLEYHTSRHRSMENLGKRLSLLKAKFNHVHYSKDIDRIVALGGRRKTHLDRVIFCWNDKRGGNPSPHGKRVTSP